MNARDASSRRELLPSSFRSFSCLHHPQLARGAKPNVPKPSQPTPYRSSQLSQTYKKAPFTTSLLPSLPSLSFRLSSSHLSDCTFGHSFPTFSPSFASVASSHSLANVPLGLVQFPPRASSPLLPPPTGLIFDSRSSSSNTVSFGLTLLSPCPLPALRNSGKSEGAGSEPGSGKSGGMEGWTSDPASFTFLGGFFFAVDFEVGGCQGMGLPWSSRDKKGFEPSHEGTAGRGGRVDSARVTGGREGGLKM